MLTRYTLSQRLIGGTAVAITVIFGLLIGLVSHEASKNALEQTQHDMRVQLDLAVSTLDYAQEALKHRTRGTLRTIVKTLPGAITVSTDRRVQTNGVSLPEVRIGNESGNANHALLERFKENYGVDTALLVRDGDTLYRASTLLKKADGSYRDGEVIKDDYAQSILKGESYAGSLDRVGHQYVLVADPIKDRQGNVVGAITARLDAEENVTLLKNTLRKIVVGTTGYLYILAQPTGDAKEGRLVLHPTLENKRISEVEDEKIRKTLEEVLARKDGELTYEWPDKTGVFRTKTVVFKTQKELNWVVVSGSYIDEFLGASYSLRNHLIILCIVLGMLLAAGIGGYTLVSLRRLEPVEAALGAVAGGDLTHSAPSDADSRHEADRMAGALNRATQGVRTLIEGIKHTTEGVRQGTGELTTMTREVRSAMESQSNAANGMAAAAEELSVSIDHVAENAGKALHFTQETVTSVDQGRGAVQDTIDAMEEASRLVSQAAERVRDLGNQSQEVQGIVATIQAIAEQTNLLALNAAIEAARAGEAGRGFAVVADEVRKLAEKANASAHDIGTILTAIQNQVTNVSGDIETASTKAHDSAGLSRTVEEALMAIEERSRQVVNAVEDIANAAREQSNAGHEIARQVENVAHLSDTTKDLALRTNALTDQLSERATTLAEEAGRFHT